MSILSSISNLGSYAFSKKEVYRLLVIVLLFKISIAVSIWEIPFSWDNWRYMATAHAISTLEFNQLVLSGKPYQSFFTFPIGLPILMSALRFLTPSLYDAGRLVVLISSVCLTFFSFKIFFSSYRISIVGILLWLLFITFKTISWTSHSIYPESILLVFIVYGFYRIILFDNFSISNAIIIGLITGISFLIKPEGLIVGLLFGFSVSYISYKENKGLLHISKPLFISLIPFLIITIPYEYTLYQKHNQLLPLITTYHLEHYAEMGGTSISKFSRNLFDNLIHIPPIQFAWYFSGLFLPFIAIKSHRLSKEIIITITAIGILLAIHSKGFGVTYLQFNPEDSLPRYTLIYVFFAFYLVHLFSKLLPNKFLIMFGMYLLLLLPFSIRNTIPFSNYYPKGWKNKLIAEDILKNKAYHPDSLLISNKEILSYLEHKNGVNIYNYKDLDKLDSTLMTYSLSLHSRLDSLTLTDIFGRKFKEINHFATVNHE